MSGTRLDKSNTHSLAPMYYRGAAAAAVVVYDITNKHSFERAKKWEQELQRQGNPNLVTVLVAKKVDLNAERSVGNEEEELYAKENSLLFNQASAKTELFYEIAKRLAESGPMILAGIKLESALHERGRKLSWCKG